MHEDSTLNAVITLTVLMLIASVSAIYARKYRFPFSILLVLVGLAISLGESTFHFLGPLASFRLSPDMVMFVFLPVLIYESAFNLDARRLIQNAAPVTILAIPALLISTAVTGAIVHLALGMPIAVSLLFGALISATDPVAVVALFKEMGAPKRLNLLVEGESLFNDGTALVVFKIILAAILAGAYSGYTIVEGVWDFIVVAAGGILTGIIFGYVFARVIALVYNEKMVEITLTTVLAYTAFITAEHWLHVSGVMATVAAGLTMGSYGRSKISPPVLEHLEAYWEYIAFVCNALIFLLVGLSIDLGGLWHEKWAIAAAFFAVLVARFLAVFSGFVAVGALFKRVEHVSMKFQTVIAWGGLRGALAIVMALSIPHDLSERHGLLNLTLGIVLLSLLVNGLTIRRLMAALGLDRYSIKESLERAQVLLHVKRAALAGIGGYVEHEGLNTGAERAIRSAYERELAGVTGELASLQRSVAQAEQSEVLLRHCLMQERRTYSELFEMGLLEENNYRDMLHGIERQLDRIKEGSELYVPTRQRIGGRVFASLARIPVAGSVVLKLKARRLAAGYELERARRHASASILIELRDLADKGTYGPEVLEKASGLYATLNEKAASRIKSIQAGYPEYVERADGLMIERYSLGMELEGYRKAHQRGELPDKVLLELEDTLSRKLRTMRMLPVDELRIPPLTLIRNVPSFAGLPAETLTDICSRCVARSFLSGETIVKQGEKGDSLFVIGRGEVDVLSEQPEGAEFRLAHLKAGDFFGETALLHPQPRTATVRAATATTMLELRRAKLLPILREAPTLGAALEDAYRKRVLNTLVANVPLFHNLDSKGRDRVASHMKAVHCSDGDVLAEEGARAVKLFIIAHGLLRVSGGQEPGTDLADGMSYVQDGELYSHTLYSDGDLDVYELDIAELPGLLAGGSEVIT